MSDLICQIFPFQPSTSMYYISLSLVFGNMMINAEIQMTIQRSSVGQLTTIVPEIQTISRKIISIFLHRAISHLFFG